MITPIVEHADTCQNPPAARRRGDFLDPREFAPGFSSGACSAPEEADGACRVVAAAVAILEQGEALLAVLTTTDYTRRVPVIFNASIGGHYRHCLDHFTSLLRGWNAAEVDYDQRERDARIETEPQFALAVTRSLREQLQLLRPKSLSCPALARCEVSYDPGDSPTVRSSLGRELVYCIAHAIHHYALIAVMARLLAVPRPSNFGVAPSTVAHLTSLRSPAG